MPIFLQDPHAKHARGFGGYDQMVLNRHVWPVAKAVVMSHDSYTCTMFPNSHPFPTKREDAIGNYIGGVIGHGARIKFVPENECPANCRPKEHQDWVYC